MNRNKWLEQYTGLHGLENIEGHEMWDQKSFNNEERAKMILDTLENDEKLNTEFIRQSRLRKLKNLKIT